MHRVPSQANQLPTATTHDPRPAQPRVGGSCSKISFPTNNAHQRRTQLSKRRQPHAHTHTEEKHRQSTNQSTTSPRQSLRLRPPKTKSPPAGHPLFYTQDTSLNHQQQQQPPRRALARKYSTKDQTDSQPSTTINNQVHAHVVLGGGHSD